MNCVDKPGDYGCDGTHSFQHTTFSLYMIACIKKRTTGIKMKTLEGLTKGLQIDDRELDHYKNNVT